MTSKSSYNMLVINSFIYTKESLFPFYRLPTVFLQITYMSTFFSVSSSHTNAHLPSREPGSPRELSHGRAGTKETAQKRQNQEDEVHQQK